jgi:DNA-binding transcriptional ArsR family regulator
VFPPISLFAILIVRQFKFIEYLQYKAADGIVSSMKLLLVHPSREDLSLPTILYALGDPWRLRIVAQLAMMKESDEKRACQDFLVGEAIAKSTLSFHLKVLREAGLIRMEPQGRRVLVSLRREDLEARFPGLLDAILSTYRQGGIHAL